MSAWVGRFRSFTSDFSLLVFAGLATFVFARRLAVFLMVAGVIGLFRVRLLVGVVEYSRVMRRQWPRVPPAADDDR